jgi:hypothetical protein
MLLVALVGPASAVGADDPPVGAFTGADGLVYESAPQVTSGLGGELFLGADLDFACGLGRAFERAMRTYSKLARVISRSGRRVVFTVAPNKSAVFPDRLGVLPHAGCDARGLAAQQSILRSFESAGYLSLLAPLAENRRQVWWKTDQHWTTVGGSVFAKQLAARLDPRLGHTQRYVYGTETRLGELNRALGIDTPETLETAFPSGGVRVRDADDRHAWAGYPSFTFDHSWRSSPPAKTWPGRTLLLGDSFMWYALENLRPIFRHGRFLWIAMTTSDVARAIKQSDTVVIEVLQLFVPGTTIANTEFLKRLRRTLR